jgi:hypothetical protein
MKTDMRRLPSPREYELLDFDGKRAVVELAQTILFQYLATERHNDV